MKAKELKINLSATLESALETQVRQSTRKNWLKENQKSIEKLNELAENNGLFSDENDKINMKCVVVCE